MALSSLMIHYLKEKISKPGASGQRKTLAALARRGLCTASGDLTHQGSAAAISHLSLAEQCRLLKLSLFERSLPCGRQPEESLLKALSDEGNLVYYTENTFPVHVVNVLLLHRLYELATKHRTVLYGVNLNTSNYPRVIHHGLRAHIDEVLRDVNERTLEENLALVKSLSAQGYWLPQDMWEPKFYRDIVGYLGMDRLRSMVRVVVGPERLEYLTGWPDLCVLSPGPPRFIEVKTTDRLTLSQIIAIPTICGVIGIPVECVKLTTT